MPTPHNDGLEEFGGTAVIFILAAILLISGLAYLMFFAPPV